MKITEKHEQSKGCNNFNSISLRQLLVFLLGKYLFTLATAEKAEASLS